tara:strand:- start:840 stop:1385 length:546 start_codon:yes stop_codon:yes gene_type:complete
MSQNVEIEISKLLHCSFSGGTAVSMRDLSRMWSLEMQWFSPDSALSLARRLHLAGWLVGSHDSLEPCSSIPDHPPEMGWRPFLSMFEEMPESPDTDVKDEAPPPTENSTGKNENREPSSVDIPLARMASIVSSMSGLERREVLRRAERKRRALGPVSLQIAILLLAREQNLDMKELIEFLN